MMAIAILSLLGGELNVVSVSIFSIVSGLVTLWFRKAFVVASTALTGAWSVLSGFAYLVGDLDLVRALAKPELLRTQGGLYYAVLALWFLIGMSGIAIQMTSGAFGHTVGRSLGMGYIEHEDGVSADFVSSGSYEIEIACTRYRAEASLKPFFDARRRTILA